MIIFGTTSTRKTLSEGEFHCPQCNTRTSYRERRAKSWGHLYWIPLIPLEEYPPYVECDACNGTFVPEVLTMDPAGDQGFAEDFERACLLSCARMALAGAGPGDARRRTIVELMKSVKTGELGASADSIDQAITDLREDPQDMNEILAPVAAGLNDNGRELIMMNLVEIALAGGQPGEAERQCLADCGEALGMSSAHRRGIVAEMDDRAKTAS